MMRLSSLIRTRQQPDGANYCDYRFVTVWHIEAPIEAVCDVIYRSLSWPQWWGSVERVEELSPGDAMGVGSVRRYYWRGPLPYRITFDICVIHIVPMESIEGIASGDVEGRGLWTFSAEGAVTIVRFEWRVRTTPVWMNWLARFARPLFKWNHDASMLQGGKALARMLNTRLIRIE